MLGITILRTGYQLSWAGKNAEGVAVQRPASADRRSYVNHRLTRTAQIFPIFPIAFVLAGLVACHDDPQPLTLDDLSPNETRYVTRFVQLERARAVALADPERGTALLDSLAAVWGDSAAADTRTLLPVGAIRAAAVHDLLARILRTEQDSLILAPLPRRLAEPLPDPAAVPPEESSR